MNPCPVVFADLRQSRASALAVVALIAVAVALGVAVTAEERALRSGTARAANDFDLVVGAKGSPVQLVLNSVYLEPGPSISSRDPCSGGSRTRRAPPLSPRWCSAIRIEGFRSSGPRLTL